MEAETIMATIMAAIAAVEVAVGVWQFHLTRELGRESARDLSQMRQDLQEMATKEALLKGLEEKATKEDMHELSERIELTVQRTVPRVLRDMAKQYDSQMSADQHGGSDVDSQ